MIQVGLWLSLDGTYGRGVALGVNDIAIDRGWVLRTDVAQEADMTRDCVGHIVAMIRPPQHLQSLRSGPLVGVEVDLREYDCPSIRVDNEAVGRVAAEHLLQRGYRDLAAFGFGSHRFSADRFRGFREAVLAAEARYDGACQTLGAVRGPTPSHPLPAQPDQIAQWIARWPSPVAVFAACDGWGQILMRQISAAGKRVPEDVAVLSVDNDELLCELIHPPLSSVEIPWRQMGRKAGMMLAQMLDGQKLGAQYVVWPPAGVVVRHSSDMLAVEDPDVAAALAWIHRHAREDISVPDVLRVVPVFRKKLEAGFRRCIGHGIMREIRRVRVEHAKRLLATTELPMPEIARRAGFANAQKLTRIFHRIAGTTPTLYRNSYRLR